MALPRSGLRSRPAREPQGVSAKITTEDRETGGRDQRSVSPGSCFLSGRSARCTDPCLSLPGNRQSCSGPGITWRAPRGRPARKPAAVERSKSGVLIFMALSSPTRARQLVLENEHASPTSSPNHWCVPMPQPMSTDRRFSRHFDPPGQAGAEPGVRRSAQSRCAQLMQYSRLARTLAAAVFSSRASMAPSSSSCPAARHPSKPSSSRWCILVPWKMSLKLV